MTITEKKAYIKDMNRASMVAELVQIGCDIEEAVDYVYDGLTMTTAEFRMKYYGF